MSRDHSDQTTIYLLHSYLRKYRHCIQEWMSERRDYNIRIILIY